MDNCVFIHVCKKINIKLAIRIGISLQMNQKKLITIICFVSLLSDMDSDGDVPHAGGTEGVKFISAYFQPIRIEYSKFSEKSLKSQSKQIKPRH